jgi:Flp pilus assembly protein TadG
VSKQSKQSDILKAFMKDDEGGIIIFALLILMPMLLVGGMAVDFMRIENERVVLQGVTDRAVLNAASITQEGDPETLIYEFFDIAGYEASQVTPNIIKNDSSGRTISANATSDINTFYLRLAGINTLTTASTALAEEGVNLVEISLVLDYSASMRTGGSTGRIVDTEPLLPGDPNYSSYSRGRIGDLQDAAREFAKELLKPEFDGRFSLNIVPYGGHVNPGPVMFDRLNGIHSPPIYIEDEAFNLAVDSPFVLENTVFWADDINEGFPGNYVYAGIDGLFGNSDDVPLNDLLADEFQLLGDAGNLSPASLGDPNIDPMVFGPDLIYGTSDDDQTADGILPRIAYEYDHPSHCLHMNGSDWTNSAMPSGNAGQLEIFMHYGYGNWEIERGVRGWGWCLNDDMQIQYAQQDPDAVDDFFDNIALGDGTGTDIGMKWGLALLDPSARPHFAAMNAVSNQLVPDASVGRPADWDDARTDKILVLMTDGFITKQTELDRTQDTRHLQQKTSGNTNTTTTFSRDETRVRFLAMCEFAKDPDLRDVEVWTVAFETNDAAGALMEQCASPDRYRETSGTGLTEVFVDIARQITSLRLTQ